MAAACGSHIPWLAHLSVFISLTWALNTWVLDPIDSTWGSDGDERPPHVTEGRRRLMENHDGLDPWTDSFGDPAGSGGDSAENDLEAAPSPSYAAPSAPSTPSAPALAVSPADRHQKDPFHPGELDFGPGDMVRVCKDRRMPSALCREGEVVWDYRPEEDQVKVRWPGHLKPSKVSADKIRSVLTRDKEAEENIRVAAMMGQTLSRLFSFGVRVAIQLIFAFCYKKKVVDRKNVLNASAAAPMQGPGYKFTLCGCCEDFDICLHAFFCMPTRAADTYHSAGVLDFWVTLLLALFCSPCFLLCIMPFKHAEIRGLLGGSAQCSCEDFCVSCFCNLCIVSQEARSIDEALGKKTKCCCNLITLDDTRVPLVGEVVALSAVQVATPVAGIAVQGTVLQPPPMPWQPLVPIAAVQAFQAPAAGSYAPAVPVQQVAGAQALQVSGREVMMQTQPHSSPAVSQDTELQPMNEEGERKEAGEEEF